MSFGEWTEDLKLQVYEWPVWLKLSMTLPGALGGYIFAWKMGLNGRHWAFVGGFLGLILPFMVIFLIEALWLLLFFGVILGLARLAFGPEVTRSFFEFWSGVLGGIWYLVKAIFHWAVS